MKRSRGIIKYLESSDSEDEHPLKKASPIKVAIPKHIQESSSESDIGNYLLKPDKVNLDSEFFNGNLLEFENLEKKMFAGITKLTDSESDTEEEEKGSKDQIDIKKIKTPLTLDSNSVSSSKISFKQLQDYTKKIEEAKKHIAIYRAKKQAKENTTDIFNLLAVGERKLGMEQTLKRADLHSSDFESCDSEQEDWEEIKAKTIQENQEKSLVPKKSLQITVDMPDNVKKKTGVDLLAAMKRRLNRIRKENQILVHQVHLLCWLAHGNYVNSAINDTETLAMALSLLPSDQCYPSDRIDLSYLEKIVNWYKRTVKNIEKPVPEDISLNQCLQTQISRKEAYNKKMVACIFVSILRALGIQCRIVMSLQVEPLRPPISELHTVSNKGNGDKEINMPKIVKIKKVSKTSVSKQPIIKSPTLKLHTKKSTATSEEAHNLDIDLKLTKGKGRKFRSITIPISKTKFEHENNHNINADVIPSTSVSTRLEEGITKENPMKISKSDGAIAGKKVGVSKRIESEKKLSKVKNVGTKSTHTKTTKARSEGILQQVKDKEFSNTKSGELKLPNYNEALESTPNMLGTKKRTKSTKSKDNGILSKTNSRSLKSSKKIDVDSKTKLRSKNLGSKEPEILDQSNIKLNTYIPRISRHTKTTESKGSIKSSGSRRSIRGPKGTTSKNALQNQKLETQLDIMRTRTHTQSAASEDSAVYVKNIGSQPQSLSNVNNSRISRRKTQKTITQVDGIYDSDTDAEMILQLDGANDNKKQSKGQVSPDLKIDKKYSSSHSVETKTYKRMTETDSESEFEPPTRSPVNRKRLSRTVKTLNLRKLTAKKRLPAQIKQVDVRNDVMNLVKGRIIQQKHIDRNRLAKKEKPNIESESDEDYVPKPIKKKYHDSDNDFVPKTKVKRRVQIPGKSVLSDGENELGKEKKKGNDVWVEVFLEAEETWICVDVIYGQVHCVKEVHQRATHPVSYIIAWDNSNKLKDVTQRYCRNFNTLTRKQRVEPKWWNDSLKPFMGTPTARDKEEDDDLARQQLDQPLPKAISEYKNHPHYALKRHLLKFEALYPPEPPTLGFIRGEAVYLRTCIYTLHSRDIWLKQAKVVKFGEQPYKIVKARPKYDRLSNKVITDQMLEIFGPWQVQDYEPPTAENGIVPKNAFGNVDLFKSCMLPKGCVHLKLPGLNKIARKMNIDCASAIVGFDFHGGWSHPVYDGFVVCREYEDQLICAWEMEQDELERREEEKIDKRVYGNWKKLIKGLLIRERLKAKYDFGEPSASNPKDKMKIKCLALSTKKL